MEQKQYEVVEGQRLNDVPTDSRKAVASGIVATVVTFLSTLQVAIGDGITPEEWISIALATVIGAAAGFGITYATPTRVK